MPLISWVWDDPIPRLLAAITVLAAGWLSDALNMNEVLAGKPAWIALPIAFLWIVGPAIPVLFISGRYVRATEWRKVLAAENQMPADAVHLLIGLRTVIRGIAARDYAEQSILDRIPLLGECNPISARTVSYLHDELLRPDVDYVLSSAQAFRDLLIVLKILPSVGTSESLLVIGACELRYASSEVIVEVARQSETALKERLATERLSESLLRPSEGSGNNVLLRPSGGKRDSANLLTASEPASNKNDSN